MLFCNVDHIEPELLPKTREASARFFEANLPFNELFRQMELGNDRTPGSKRQQEASLVAARAAARAQEQFQEAGQLLRELAGEIVAKYSYMNAEIKRANVFDDAARYVQLAPNSSTVREMVSDLLRSGVDSLLLGCAERLFNLSARTRSLGIRISEARAFQDRDYDEAHSLIADWNLLTSRGQFISAVCMMAARVAG